MKGMREHLYDKRVVRRNMENGLVKKADFEAHVGALPDVEDNIAPPEEPEEEGDAETETETEAS